MYLLTDISARLRNIGTMNVWSLRTHVPTYILEHILLYWCMCCILNGECRLVMLSGGELLLLGWFAVVYWRSSPMMLHVYIYILRYSYSIAIMYGLSVYNIVGARGAHFSTWIFKVAAFFLHFFFLFVFIVCIHTQIHIAFVWYTRK